MLEIRGLEKRFGAVHALRGVDLDIAAGEIVGLLGHNGAGKTTLVSIVVGLLRPDAGSVTVDGIDAARSPERVRARLGLAPQELGLYPPLRVRDNLRFFGELGGLRGARLASRVGEVAEALGLTELMARPAGELSGGQQRRLHTGIALLHRPRLLFLDEPTVGADVHSRAQLLEVVRELAAEGCAVCYATHYLPEVEALGASVAVLEQGRVIARDTVDGLIRAHAHSAVQLRFSGPTPALRGWDVDGELATCTTEAPSATVAAALGALGDATDRLQAIEFVQPSLERAYLALTGRRKVEPAASATSPPAVPAAAQERIPDVAVA